MTTEQRQQSETTFEQWYEEHDCPDDEPCCSDCCQEAFAAGQRSRPPLDDAMIERIADRVYLYFNMNWEQFESGAKHFKPNLLTAIRDELSKGGAA